jgi:hypothetical protein
MAIVSRVPTQTMSEVPPTVPAPVPGDLWWNTRTGQEFILYDDGNTVQWVIANKGNGDAGDAGEDAFARTTQDFVMPVVMGNATAHVTDDQLYTVNQLVYLQGAGYFKIFGLLPQQLVLTNLGSTGNVLSGVIIAAGAAVLAVGPPGVTDPTVWAALDSPHFTGTPLAPTAAQNTDTDQIATTKFVNAEIGGQLGFFLPLTGGTITGNFLGVSHTADVFLAVNSTDAGVGRPRFQLKKQNVLVGQISADGINIGSIYYESFGASALHEFFVAGSQIFTVLPGGVSVVGTIVGSGSLVVGSNSGGVQHQLKMGNNTVLGVYSDTAGEIVIDAFDATTPATKLTINLNKYGGAIKLPTVTKQIVVSETGGGAEGLLIHPTDNQNPVMIGLWNNGGAADQKRARLLQGADGSLRMRLIKDNGTIAHDAYLRSDGYFLTENLWSTGIIVAQSDLTGYAVWSSPTAGAQPTFYWNGSGFTANQQKWRSTMTADGKLHFQSIDDSGVVQNDIIFNRDGTIAGTGVGGWRPIGTFNPANAVVDVTALPADINHIQVFYDVVPTTNDLVMAVQLYDSSTGLDTTANHYGSVGQALNNGVALGTAPAGYSSVSAGYTSGILLGLASTAGNNVSNNASTGGVQGSFKLFNIKQARVKHMTGDFSYLNGAGTLQIGGTCTGWRNIAAAINGFRLSFGVANGPMTGVVRVWGSP